MIKRIVGYARVSKREQAANSNALQQQIQRLKDAGAGEVYSDVQSSFKDRERPKLEALLDLVRKQQVDEVIITRLDRLSRRGSQSFSVFDVFIDANVGLRALDQSFDLTSAAGRMVAGLLAVVAQNESDLKTEATRHGTAYRRRQRKAFHPPFGFVMDEKGVLHHDTQELLCLIKTRQAVSSAQIAREYVDTYIELESLARTVRLINERYGLTNVSKHRRKYDAGLPLSKSGLSNWLKNPVLRGHLRYLDGKENAWDTHEPLITEREWQRIQEIFEMNQQQGGFGNLGRAKHPLSGLIVCDVCGRKMFSNKGADRKKKTHYRYYHCDQARSGQCSNSGYIREEVIEDSLIRALASEADEIANSVVNDLDDQGHNPEVEKLETELAKVLELARQSGDGGGFLQNHADLLRSQIEQEKNAPAQVDDSRRNELADIGRDPSFWRCTLERDEKRILYHHFTRAIFVKDRKVVRIELKV